AGIERAAIALMDRMLRELGLEILRFDERAEHALGGAAIHDELDLRVGNMREVRADRVELRRDAMVAERPRCVDDEHDLRALRQRPDLRRDIDLEPLERMCVRRDDATE